MTTRPTTLVLIHLERPKWPAPQEAAARIRDHLTELDQRGRGLGLLHLSVRPSLGAFDVVVELTHGDETTDDAVATAIAKLQRLDGIRRTLTLPVLEETNP